MIKKLMKKYFPVDGGNPASAEHQEEVTQMTQETEQTVASADNTAVAELVAQLASQTEAIAALQSQYDLATAALAQSAEAQATLVANAKAAVLVSRTASLSAIMGDVKGPQMAASLESLSDETFATVLSGYAASFEAESKSPMFQEAGVSAEALPVVEVDEVQKMAAKFAAEFAAK